MLTNHHDAKRFYAEQITREPQFVEDWKRTCIAVQEVNDDLFDILEHLRAQKDYVHADRLRTLMGRLARAVPECPAFGSWDGKNLIRNLARTWPDCERKQETH